MLSDVIFVDVDVISKGVEIASEHQGGVHERARVHEFAFFSHLHLLDVEYEAPVEDLRSQSTLSSENHDFVVSDLVSKTHVSLDPVGLVHLRSSDLLPNVFGDAIALNGVNNVLLINSSSESKDKFILESTQGNTRSCDSETVNLLPFILLNVVHFTESVDLAVNKGSDNVNESFDCFQ
mgnify:CR=1 FL=1